MKAAIVVAHPDDETLWCGGEVLKHRDWQWFVVSLCRASDRERRRRFANALHALGADGQMADLDDGPTQEPLSEQSIQTAILERLPSEAYDVVFTHGPRGEYTRHRRHEECCLAVFRLWQRGQLRAGQMKLFAYQDEGGAALPHVAADAHERWVLGAETLRANTKSSLRFMASSLRAGKPEPPLTPKVSTASRTSPNWRR